MAENKKKRRKESADYGGEQAHPDVRVKGTMKRPKRERLIIDNRSSRPLYEAYEQAFDFYFQEWCEEYDTQAMTWNGFVFYMRTNKDSITIQIYDDKNK